SGPLLRRGHAPPVAAAGWGSRLPPAQPLVPEGNRPALRDTGFTRAGAAKPHAALHQTGRAPRSLGQAAGPARPAGELRVRSFGARTQNTVRLTRARFSTERESRSDTDRDSNLASLSPPPDHVS